MMKSLSIFTKNLQEKNNLRLSNIFEKKFLEKAKKSNITKPYQFFGIWIAQNLDDYKNIPLYIKLAKEQDKVLLESAISYIKDYPNAKSKSRLFLWYLKGKIKIKDKKPVKKKKDEKIALFSKRLKKKKIKVGSLIAQKNKIENIEKPSETNIKKDVYFDIYKVDYFCEKENICFDIIDKSNLNLANKLYFRKKTDFLISRKIKYYQIDKADYKENPDEIIRNLLKM